MYYKAVKNINGKLLPLVHSNIGVEYKVNEWTKPLKGSHLICLSNLYDAYEWRRMYSGEVWECEVIQTKKIPIFLYKANSLTGNVLAFIERINKLKRAKKKFSHLVEKGPYVFCDAIKLVRKINDNRYY